MKKSKKCSLIVSKSAQEVFDKYRQTRNTHVEACGILIGNHKINAHTVYIKFATIPQINDIRSRCSFKLNSASHQCILDAYFKISQNEDVYIGTWHSHPENNPTPSDIDISDWNEQYRQNKNLFTKMFFLIVGIKKIGFWMIENGKLMKLPLEEIVYEYH